LAEKPTARDAYRKPKKVARGHVPQLSEETWNVIDQ
jgi:hypothetical protein